MHCDADYETQQDLFWSQVRKFDHPDACWEWTGTKAERGHGIFPLTDPLSGRKRPLAAYRVAIYFLFGRLPTYAKRLCSNTSCVRPTHYWVGDPLARTRSKTSRTRRNLAPGSSSYLTPEEARDIRDLVHHGADEKELAASYGVSRRDIARIAMGRTFKDAGGPIRPPKKRGIKEHHEAWIQHVDHLRERAGGHDLQKMVQS